MNEKNDRIAPAAKARPEDAKLAWKAPEIRTMEARDGEASFTYGGVDSGIYHS